MSNPMGIFGGFDIDYDPTSGDTPKSVPEKLAERKERSISQSRLLARDLRQRGGEVIGMIGDRLEMRINELIQSDPACRELLAILDQVGLKISMKDTIIQGKMDRIFQ